MVERVFQHPASGAGHLLAIVAAIQRELAGIERALESKRRSGPGARYIVEGEYGGRRLVLATTGPGGSRAGDVVSTIANSYRPSALLCLGYAGAASAVLRAGDLVLYSRVSLGTEGLATVDYPAPKPVVSPDPGLEAAARRALRRVGLSFHKGQGVTVSHSMGDPEAKRRAGLDRGVMAMDMESYWVAEAAGRNHLPFLGIRAITDPVGQRVPDLTALVNGNGNISIVKSLAHALEHPLDIYPMARLGWSSRMASRNLARFVWSFLACYE